MGVTAGPESLEILLPVSHAPADKKHPPGSSYEGDDPDGEGGESDGDEKDALATLMVNDDLAEAEEPLPLQAPVEHVLASLRSTHRSFRQETLTRGNYLQEKPLSREGAGIAVVWYRSAWCKGAITRQLNQPRVHHPYTRLRELFSAATAACTLSSLGLPSTPCTMPWRRDPGR